MSIEILRDQWVCSCGNWVDITFHWCPDCCEDKLVQVYDAELSAWVTARPTA